LYDQDTEAPLPGVMVTLEMLVDDAFQPVQTTVTNADGLYEFTGLEPGTYLINVNNTVGDNDSYVFSPQVENGNVVNANGISPFVQIGYNDVVDDWLVGMYLPLADIGPNLVFNDLDEDGVYDPETEGPLAGVQIELNCDGQVVATTTTNTSGYYEFTNVQPGDCYIEVEPEVNNNNNYVFSPVYEVDPENPDTTGNQIYPNGTSPTVPIDYDDTVDDWNVGMYLPLSQIGPNTAFNDLNMNGVWDVEDEPVLANVPIALICDGSEVATTTTNATGMYEFNDVQPGDCNIQVTSLGEDYTFSPVTTGGNQIDPANGSSPTVTIGYDDTVDTWDIGMFMPPATIGPNVVFNDTDGDGQRDPMEQPLENVTIHLYCLNENNQYVLTDTVVTDALGQYQFENVQPGLCYISVDPPTDPETNEPYVPSPVCNETGCNQVYPNGTTVPEDIDWNDTIDDWNVGLYLPVTIGNKVWDDLNGNRVQDDGEPGIPNVPVALLDGSGNPVVDDNGDPITTSTDDSGTYWFTDLPPGEYSVQFDLPDTYVFGPEGPSSDSLLLDPDEPIPDISANIDDTTSTTAPQTLVSGENNTSFDAGIYVPVVVGGSVWDDINGNGLLDAGEEPLEGAGVTIFDENDQVVNWVSTSPDGTYAIDLPPGTYYAMISPPADGNDYKLSPITPNGSDFDPDTMTTAPVTLASGDSGVGSFDAGFYVPVTVTSYVWADADGDGIQDPEEGGYQGPMVVNLYNDTHPDDPFISVVTNVDDGTFQITDIPPGDYVFEFVPEDPNVIFSPPNQGGDDSLDSDVDPETGRTPLISLNSGDEITDVAAGITNMPSIGPNIVCDDLNADGLCDPSEPGLQAVAVTLYDDEGAEVAVAFTDENGEYSFTNLEPGSYYISVNKDPSYEFSPVVDGGNVISPNEDVVPYGNRSPTVTLAIGDNDDTLIVAMYDPVTIGNKVWDDLNGDGVQQLTEPGMEGVTATLLDVNGVALKSTTTDQDGHYYFNGIPPGGYAVKFSLPDGYIFTVQAKDSVVITDPTHPDACLEYGCVTSDADRETGITDTKFVTSGTDNYSFDAGMFIPVTISGTTWHDLNADGIRQPEEGVVEGATVSLYDGDGDLIGIRVTDPSIRVAGEDGTWIFQDMPPGVYQAMITPPDGEWTLSPQPADRTVVGTDFDPDTWMTSPIYLQGGDSGEGLFDAGLYLPATIGDRVWFDNLPNGIQDGDEVAFDQPVQIKLYDELGYLQAETESDLSGFYTFYPVRPGTYSLEFILNDDDYQWTIPNAGNDTDVDSDVSPTSSRASVTVTSGEEKLDIDAGVMDFGPYYPDWTNDVQVCTNDGFDPAWLEIQKVNYLYKNKEDCCKNHFWWRMTQCMANEEFHFYQNGDICDTKIYFEDWEDNSPAEWIDTKHFDTIEECCANTFWFDYDGCIHRSPVMFKFEFCVDVQGLIDPPDCQSADIYANVLEDAINEGCYHTHGIGDHHEEEPAADPVARRLAHIPDVTTTDANITKIGGVSLTKESGSTVCGGSLGGQGFINELTGTIPDIEAAENTIVTVCGVITVEEAECKEEECLREHYHAISDELESFVNNGDLTLAINRRATTRLPPVPELQVVSGLPFSLVTQNLVLPATVTGDVNTKYYRGTDLSSCEGRPELFFKGKDLVHYDTLRECCAANFWWDEAGCRSAFSGRKLAGRKLPAPVKEDAVAKEEEGAFFYATWRENEWCSSKNSKESWEDESDFYPTRAACCESLNLKAEHNAECLRLATA
jgi:protocatechuate 3,4-dioxygenase beta subunit